MTAICSNPASWHPRLHTKQDHHVPPKSWRLVMLQLNPDVDQSWWTVEPLCGLCHDEWHTLLNAFVHAKGEPPKSVTRTYSRYLLAQVHQVWANRPPDGPTPYTLSSGPE